MKFNIINLNPTLKVFGFDWVLVLSFVFVFFLIYVTNYQDKIWLSLLKKLIPTELIYLLVYV